MAAIYHKQYALGAFPNQAVIINNLRKELQAAGIQATLDRIDIGFNKVNLWFSTPVTPKDMLAMDTVITSHAATVAIAKSAAFAAIDAKTDQIIARGFTFAGKTFSTSLDAQARLLGMDTLRNDPMMVYPITFNTLDDNDSISIPDATTVHGFVLTGIGYYRVAIDTGSTLKAQVRLAVTVAEVLAVEDTRT